MFRVTCISIVVAVDIAYEEVSSPKMFSQCSIPSGIDRLRAISIRR
jgi:hypothetical protein